MDAINQSIAVLIVTLISMLEYLKSTGKGQLRKSEQIQIW